MGKDIAEILGYINASKAVIDRVDAEDKLTSQFGNTGQMRNMTVINESGLYSLILSSKLPSAKQFKHWVTSEVLPTIRKHGMYATEELLDNPDLLISVATALKEEREKRKTLETEKQALQTELDYSKEWYSIKRVAALNSVSWKMFDWKKLKAKSLDMGFSVKKIFDANYGEVNTYHCCVWMAAYPDYEI